jgi:hypothetical protein
MKFMLMMQGTQKGWESMGSWSQDDFKAHIGFMKAFNQRLVESGEFVMAEGLDLPSTAKVVRATTTGSHEITDGPFPETKEFLAGFWIVDVESPERAFALAAEASAAPGKGGAPVCVPIEVRMVPSGPPDSI